MKLYAQDNSVLMEISAIERQGNNLVLKGKVFGSMPMTARLKPEEARKGLKLLGFKLVLFGNLRPVSVHPALIPSAPLRPELLEAWISSSSVN